MHREHLMIVAVCCPTYLCSAIPARPPSSRRTFSVCGMQGMCAAYVCVAMLLLAAHLDVHHTVAVPGSHHGSLPHHTDIRDKLAFAMHFDEFKALAADMNARLRAAAGQQRKSVLCGYSVAYACFFEHEVQSTNSRIGL